MLQEERRTIILDLLYKNRSVTVSALSEMFSVSLLTVRRDLEKLEQEGIIRKTHGGAYLVDSLKDVPIYIRNISHRREKNIIGELAAKFVMDGDNLILFYSTTTMAMIPWLGKKSNLTVITNSPISSLELAKYSSISTRCTGGVLVNDTNLFSSLDVADVFSKYYSDKAFISASGISMDRGLTDTNESTAYLLDKAIDSAKETFLLIDHSKLGKSYYCKIKNYTKIDNLITDLPLKDDWVSFLSQMGTKAFWPGMESL